MFKLSIKPMKWRQILQKRTKSVTTVEMWNVNKAIFSKLAQEVRQITAKLLWKIVEWRNVLFCSTNCNKMADGGHTFVKKNFHKPTYCHHCSDLLWFGLIGQGYICEGKLAAQSFPSTPHERLLPQVGIILANFSNFL